MASKQFGDVMPWKSGYKFGDITRWLIAWYNDHPNSLPHKIDWLKVTRTVVSTIIVGGTLNFGTFAAILEGSINDPTMADTVTALITAIYAVCDLTYRVVFGKPKDPTPTPTPTPGPAPVPTPGPGPIPQPPAPPSGWSD